MMMESQVDAWEPLARVRWFDDSGWMGEGTALAVEWQLSTQDGKTRVRLVQSAFGESEGWADLFDGTEVGWTYFLYNLRESLERHRGRTRTMVSERLPSPVPRAQMWKRLVDRSLGKLAVGDRVHVMLGGAATPGIVEMLVPQRALALRMPELGDALLFAELEGKGDKFSIGYWLSLYDAQIAGRVEKGAKRAFRPLHAPG